MSTDRSSGEQLAQSAKPIARLWDGLQEKDTGIYALLACIAQRIALGRAIVNHPKYLLLDEATSAIDQGTASQILTGLDSHKDQWTIVQVTHDPLQAQSADYVVVLNDGNVEAEGEPDEVAKTSAYYRQFIASRS